jgi:Na+/H+ antiporter NhaD/arsenite permease-like protein
VLTAVVLALTYLGLAFGRIPRLRVDRSGIVLVASALLLLLGKVSRERALQSVDGGTLVLLGSLMLVAAQLEEGGVFEYLASKLATLRASPFQILGILVAGTGCFSALLTNDVAVFVFVPIVARTLHKRRMHAPPFLLGMAAAANVGSAATTIGNPQNVLIGQAGNLPFMTYLSRAIAPSVLGLLIVWAWFSFRYRTELRAMPQGPVIEPPPKLQGWAATLKGLGCLAGILASLVLHADLLWTLAITSLVLVSRFRESRRMLAKIDWPMLLLFTGLFVVTSAAAPYASKGLAWAQTHGLVLSQAGHLDALCILFGNSVGNVPFVALLLPIWKTATTVDLIRLGVLSTFAGNFFVLGSVANIIVIERAQDQGITITFWDHAKSGVPITALTMAMAGMYFALNG